MSLWIIEVHPSGQTPHATQWVRSRFVIGTEIGENIFTVQGKGILPRHVRVALGEENATLEALSEGAQTIVQGALLEGAVVSEYPVRLRIGDVDMLVERASASRCASGSHVSASDLGGNALVEIKERSYFTPQDEAPGEQRYFQRTMAFALEMDTAPFGKSVTVEKIYALKGEIARGGMGHVFLAEDKTLNRQVALKVGHTGDATAKAAFHREARILSRLSHPNIVPVHNFGEDAAGRPFYSMKLVRGQTLNSVIQNLQKNDPPTMLEFSLQRLLNVFRRVCDAIEFAHSVGYMHRDIKPENVMIGEDSEVWVIDWGLAQALRQASSPNADDVPQHDRKYAVEGTPQYMSPEQALGSALDERADIYSLGAILYAILTFQAPVQGISLSEILNKVKSGAISAMKPSFIKPRFLGLPATKEKGIPQALESVVYKAMHLDRSKRYKRVTDLICDIEAYQGGFATSAEGAGVVRQIGLLIRRHRVLAAVLAFSLSIAAVLTVRLAASERYARAQAVLAKENARLAEESVSFARSVESAEVELCSACRSVMTSAILGPTSSAGSELDKPIKIAPFTLDAPNHASVGPVLSHWRRKDELIVLLSYGSVRLVNWISGAGPALGKMPTRDIRPRPLSVPLRVASREVARIAVFPRLDNQSEAVSRTSEIMVESMGALSVCSILKLNEKFLMRIQFSLDCVDQRLPENSSDRASVPLIPSCNQCVDWTRNPAGTLSSTFTGSSQEKKQAVQLYLGRQIVELDAMTRAFFCTILPSED